jgi:hypothetical protein
MSCPGAAAVLATQCAVVFVAASARAAEAVAGPFLSWQNPIDPVP